jgi:hypothetical protein
MNNNQLKGNFKKKNNYIDNKTWQHAEENLLLKHYRQPKTRQGAN